VNGKCTCGVELVEGARFCHKCGRPVDGFEPIVDVDETPVPDSSVAATSVETPTPPPLPAPTIGFRNRDTVRAALMSSAITFLPSFAIAQILAVLIFLGLLINGLLSVLLYLRRTGRGMTTIEGARQGWISGLFFSLFTTVMSTLALATSDKSALSEILQQAKSQGAIPPEAIQMLSQPGVLAAAIIVELVIAFVLFTSLASIGGMLGARLFGSARPSQETHSS
jgi:hypothetical protein